MINQYLVSEDNKKVGYDETTNNYYYEKFDKKIQCYSITWRGSIPLAENNWLIKMLYDNGIRYKYSDYMSKTRDDCGKLKYYNRITFYTDRNYFHDDYRKSKISWDRLKELIKND